MDGLNQAAIIFIDGLNQAAHYFYRWLESKQN